MQHREHIIDGKRVEAKAAVPRHTGSGNTLTKKMFVGGTVSLACTADIMNEAGKMGLHNFHVLQWMPFTFIVSVDMPGTAILHTVWRLVRT